MFGPKSSGADPRPQSAVSSGVGLAGLIGLGCWVLIARQYGMDGPYSALAACAACALPMIIWSLLYDKVHLRPTTGIDWQNPRPLKETLDVSIVKLTGLWATWGLIALIYCIGRWYWTGQYQFSMDMMETVAPWLVAISVPYVLWLDRYLVDPRDGAWHLGQFLIRQRGSFEPEQIYHHLRAWAVKGFFLAFMISIVPGGFGDFVRLDFAEIAGDPVAIAHWLIVAMFVVDVQFATVGYLLTMKPLDAHIRTANPYLGGWVAALICYPPFALMYPGGPLHYEVDTAGWDYWFQGHETLLWIWGSLLVILTAIYAWATVAFGLRFSNLTHRGILTHGPYSWTKHPAYMAKNAYWWLASLPFLTVGGNYTDMIRNAVILAAVSGVYYWRAKTEEKHLLADPAYKEYAEWMDRNAPIPRAINWAKRRSGWWGPDKGRTPDIQPAE
ncbi:Isoprenylcysteine carboxyl methyltransferase (ICMT) family protein [Parasphingorhabdus marina DSM 22363]|uniref:Isoprenylcysteine carboxyl methyltransferase (ICMT) family protein n=1 Tax=Parasphingorhabdus marina DSM 22363 TaxID=1123272 RepID=A0A1N6CMB9_9SPHN|nr:isoprenylcysteine carboxylmethyltransferase family protein [Parasphingorhabdus marina]SIN59599.1 Isoprenylcysteine carboxyl methyltransferase (ICMT) family protein [Parasphingorhabdus marina DSM 22363]